MRHLIGSLTALLCLGWPATGCASAAPDVTSSGTAPVADTVVIKDFMFGPGTLTVSPGATVRVRNEDSTAHTLSATGKAFDTGSIAANGSTTFTAPAKPGSYPYICDIHQFMQGTLVVT